MTVCETELPYDFATPRPLVVRFSDLELSSDAGILLTRQVEEQLKICQHLTDWSRMVECFITRYKQAPKQIVLDIDGWDDPTHGEQQLSFFHGYYGQHMYFPVLIHEADSGYPLVLQLRAGHSHPGKGVAGILRWLFWRLKQAFAGVEIVLRADAGFALPEILQVCERSKVKYAIGFARNAVTERKIADLLERSRLQFLQTQQKARLFDDVYYAASTWEYPRRLVMKAVLSPTSFGFCWYKRLTSSSWRFAKRQRKPNSPPLKSNDCVRC
jgi:Transposase DDE domain group 1